MKVISNLFDMVEPGTLFIDMFTATYSPSIEEQDYALGAVKSIGWLETWAKKKKALKQGQDAYKAYHDQTRQYKLAIDLLFPDDTYERNNVLTLEMLPRTPDKSFLRISYNPAKIPYNLVESVLDHVFPNGIGDIYEQGNVTRLDIAFDIMHVRPYQIILDYLKFRFRTYYLEGGNADSIYVGRDTGVNQLYAYDKLKEMDDKGHKVKPLVDYQPPANGLSRVELRHRPNPSPKFGDLFTLKNLFAPADIIVTPPTVNGDTDFIIKRDLCVLKGIRQVIKQFSPQEDKAFADKLAKFAVFLDTDNLWETFPTALLQVYPHAKLK